MISVLILAYNSAEFVCEAIDSVLEDRATANDAEVIVFDNASQDATTSRIQARYQTTSAFRSSRSDVPLGYAGGNNAAARLANGNILLILNDDCILERGVLATITADFEDDPTLGIIQCAIATSDGGRWDSLGHRMDTWGLLEQVAAGENRGNVARAPQKVFGASGAAFAIRRDLFESLGGFDEAFGYLFEETDLCWRAQLRGFTVAVSGRAVARHRQLARYQGQYRGREGSALYLLARNRIRSMIKNFSLTYLLAGMSIHLTLLLGYAVRRSLRAGPQPALDVTRALGWNIRHLPDTVRSRRQVQRRRVVSDRRLVDSGRIQRGDFGRVLRRMALEGS